MELFGIGLRNIKRNKRRTVLNVSAVAVGTAIMIVSLGWVRGYFTSFYEGIISLDTGHAQILPAGYLDEERLLPLDLAIGDYEELADRLRQLDFVTAVAPRISFSAQIGDGTKSTRMLGRAVAPEHEAALTVIDDHIVSGSYLTAGSGVLLSKDIAGRLEVSPGDSLFLTAVDSSEAENFIEATLVGTFSLGYPAIDESLFFIDLSTAQQLLSMQGQATRLVLGFDGDASVESELSAIRSEIDGLRERGTADLRLHGWRRFVQVIVQAVEADIAGFSVIIGILYLLIVVGILNSMSMAVHERTKEIGTLRAIGMKQGQLRVLFLAEGASIAGLGAVVGGLIAGAAALYLGLVGFDLSILSGTGLPIPFGDRFTADFTVWDFLLGAGVALVTAALGTLIPLRRASKLDIAATLGSHLE